MLPKNNLTENDLKKKILDLALKYKLHHLGSYFSSVNIIDKIYEEMNDEDIFILSCGHAVVALYVVLEKYFSFNSEQLLETIGEHPKLSLDKKIYCSTGSLGMGLTVAVGRALADPTKNVYCLISDGECAEGSIWESLAFIKTQNIKNIKVFVNINGYSAYDKLDTDYLAKRLLTFKEDIVLVHTSVEQFSFLKGLNAHYCNITEENYNNALGELE